MRFSKLKVRFHNLGRPVQMEAVERGLIGASSEFPDVLQKNVDLHFLRVCVVIFQASTPESFCTRLGKYLLVSYVILFFWRSNALSPHKCRVALRRTTGDCDAVAINFSEAILPIKDRSALPRTPNLLL